LGVIAATANLSRTYILESTAYDISHRTKITAIKIDVTIMNGKPVYNLH